MILPVILAGGVGSRLWPMSRQQCPKQFLPLNSEHSMLQETLLRLEGLEHQSPTIVCGEDHRFLVAQHMQGIGLNHAQIILEPAGRNTAPAVALAALKAQEKNEDPVLLVLAADHLIKTQQNFIDAIRLAEKRAKKGEVVTFGVVPTYAETGYGYIQSGQSNDDGSFSLQRFVEKPDQVTAEQYLESDQFLWNSGMFAVKASTYLDALAHYQPSIYSACQAAMKAAEVDYDFIRPRQAEFLTSPSNSIDYALMEPICDDNAGLFKASVVPVDCGWNDVGSWSALWDVAQKDREGNALKGDVLTVDTTNCYARSDKKLLAMIGVDNLIVVDSDDATLICAKEHVQKVKSIVEQLHYEQREEAVIHRKVYRPWGAYAALGFGERDQVKRIIVNPGCKLSLQKHQHRAEHWVVVKGQARVTKDDEVFILQENESTYIPKHVKHRLENIGDTPLELIEVQTGEYLGEDDIVRYDDVYGRSELSTEK